MDPKLRAAQGLDQLKSAVLEVLKDNPGGLRNSEVAEVLGIRSSFGKGAKDFLSWSVLGMMCNDGTVRREGLKYIST
jgi:uncharacterized protein